MRLIRLATAGVATIMAVSLSSCSSSSPVAQGEGSSQRGAGAVDFQAAAISYFGELPAPERTVPGDLPVGTEIVARCVGDLGFDVRDPGWTPGSPGILVDAPLEAGESVQTAISSCRQAGIDAGYLMADDDPNLTSVLFESKLQTYECLRSNDFPTPSPPQPDDAFEVAEWNPFSVLLSQVAGKDATAVAIDPDSSADPSIKALQTAAETCPLR